MLIILTNEEKVYQTFERLGYRLGYVHADDPTHNKKTGRRVAHMCFPSEVEAYKKEKALDKNKREEGTLRPSS